MQRAPAVSVLVPCYNKAKYIEDMLASVYAQTSRDWEVIVVDDGSTDATGDVLRRHADRVSVITQPNQGASAARQRAFGAARGRYIQYLDADDQLRPTALADRVAALERAHADVAYSDWQKLCLRGSAFELGEVVARRLEDVHRDPEIACFTTFWCPPAALLYSRAIVERIGAWNPALPVIQDARYLFDAAFAGARFVYVPGVGALYREEPESLSRRNPAAFVADVVRNADEVTVLWERRGALRDEQRAALASCYHYAARESFRTDAALFGHCRERLRALDAGRGLRWPNVAAALERSVGKRAALAILSALGRPAP